MVNSRGVRLPKPLIEQVGLSDEVELLVLQDLEQPWLYEPGAFPS